MDVDSEFQPKERGKAHHHSDDRLSELSDDVLVVILSFLPVREATRTSLLSSRWNNLWRHSLRLDFNVDDTLRKIAAHHKPRTMERRKYINWVDSVVQSHMAPTLDEFRICFYFDKTSRRAIIRWLEFAFAKRVEKLELSLLGYRYVFPAELLRQGTHKTPSLLHHHTHFKSLKTLYLRAGNVNGENIDFFLRNCPFLEQLTVQSSYKMSNVEVCGPSLLLKHLAIFNCYPSGSPLKISAPNLTSLKVKTLSGLLLEHVPMLVELNLMSGCRDLYMDDLVHVLDCCISQLEILSVDLTGSQGLELHDLPEMPKLKKLKAECSSSGYLSHVLASFIEASPHLQELEVKLIGRLSCKNYVGVGFMDFQHHHLKVLKISGCGLGSSEIELVREICENCMALEKIIIDPCYQQSHPYDPQIPEADIVREIITRSYAKQELESHVPDHIQLLIL